MEAVVLGSTGIKVNKNGFGALPIQRVSTEDAVKLARKAYEAGITFFDTALEAKPLSEAIADGWFSEGELVKADGSEAGTDTVQNEKSTWQSGARAVRR